MMHWFLNMVDREIAEYMNMARRTVNTRRQKAYRLLKELMGGEADGEQETFTRNRRARGSCEG